MGKRKDDIMDRLSQLALQNETQKTKVIQPIKTSKKSIDLSGAPSQALFILKP